MSLSHLATSDPLLILFPSSLSFTFSIAIAVCLSSRSAILLMKLAVVPPYLALLDLAIMCSAFTFTACTAAVVKRLMNGVHTGLRTKTRGPDRMALRQEGLSCRRREDRQLGGIHASGMRTW